MDELDWKYNCPLFESCTARYLDDLENGVILQISVFLNQPQEPMQSFVNLVPMLCIGGGMSSKWLCFRGQDGAGGPLVLAGKQLSSTVYIARP